MTEEQRKKANKRMSLWKKENKDRINFLMEKGTKEKISAAAAAAGVKPSEWLRSAIDEKLKREKIE